MQRFIMFAVFPVRIVNTALDCSATVSTRLRQRVRMSICSYSSQQRSFMSTQALAYPDEDLNMMLILGKPGGGKGTISGKILKVCTVLSKSHLYGNTSAPDDKIRTRVLNLLSYSLTAHLPESHDFAFYAPILCCTGLSENSTLVVR